MEGSTRKIYRNFNSEVTVTNKSYQLIGRRTAGAAKRRRTAANNSRAVCVIRHWQPLSLSPAPGNPEESHRRLQEMCISSIQKPKKKTKAPYQDLEAHSYRLFVSLDASVTGEAGQRVHGQTGHLTFEKPSQTQQHRSQEQVLLLGLAGGPEPEHGRDGAHGLGRRVVPREELH